MTAPPQGPTTEDARHVIERRAAQLLQHALQGDPVSAEQVGELQRLHALSELAASAPAKTTPAWPVPAAGVATLLLVSLLLFARVPSTEIELDAELSEVTFVVASHQAILGTRTYDAVGAGELQSVGLPLGAAKTGVLEGSDGRCTAEVSVTGGETPAGTVSLEDLSLPADTVVSVTARDRGVVDLLVQPPRAQHVGVELAVMGRVRTVARCAGDAVDEETDYASPQRVTFEGAAATPLSLQLTIGTASSVDFESEVVVKELAMVRVNERFEGRGTSVREVSNLLSGTLYFESLNGKSLALRPYERVRFARSEGVIRKLTLSRRGDTADGVLTMHLQARVEGMTAGPERNARNLMPTYLEWLTARQGLALLWGSTLYITGLLISLMRWLKVTT